MANTNWLNPGTIYPTIDEALHAASCLCGLDPAGATIWGATIGHIATATGEAYQIECASVRADGSTWAAPVSADYAPVYTITRRGR